MHPVTALLAAALLLAAPVLAPAAEPETGQIASPHAFDLPPWFKNSFLDLREDLKEAAVHKKRVVLFFQQDGCPYCRELLQVNFADKVIADKTRAHFDVIALNLWGDAPVTWTDGTVRKEKDFAAFLKVQFTPTLLFLDEGGKTVLRLNGFYPPHKFMAALDYVSGRQEGKRAFGDYLKGVDPTPSMGLLHDEPFFMTAPLVLQRNVKPAARPLVVFFEQKQCAGCDEMHTLALKDPETRARMERFDAARVNLFGKAPLLTPDGRKTTEVDWGRDLKVAYTPSLVFFDERGREVFRTEAYLKTFHLQSALDYVSSGAYRTQPSFQRFIQARADELRAKGIEVDLWK